MTGIFDTLRIMQYDPDIPDGRKDMQSEADIRRILDATYEGEAADDTDIESIRRILSWILGESKDSADMIIQEELIDPYE